MQGTSIVLVGYRCSGKTTVGKLLADYLTLPFIDTDTRAELLAGMPITRIFSHKGEPYFRQIESEIILMIKETDRQVIATGAGLVIDQVNCQQLRKLGKVVYLNPSVEIILERMKKEEQLGRQRPGLTGPDWKAETPSLMQQRHRMYELIADVRIDDATSPEEIMQTIVRKLRLDPEQ